MAKASARHIAGKNAIALACMALFAATLMQNAWGDPHADAVDDSLTDINDESCTDGGLNGGCIGQPAFVLGAPDFVPGQGGTTASLGLNGTLGLVFVDEYCVVDDDISTPDIIVYEQGGIQTEDFAVDAARVGQAMAGNPISSIQPEGVNQPARMLDLTRVIGGSGQVDRIQIIDIDDAGDAGSELPGFEIAAGADLDAVECFPTRVAVEITDQPDPVNAGELVTFLVRATNIGVVPATDVVVRDTLASELSFISVNPNASICSHSGDLQGGIVTCAIGDLAPGEAFDIEIQAQAPPTDFAILTTNSALVFTSQPGVSDTDSETTTIAPAIAELNVSMFDNVDPLPAGEQQIYTIQVGNGGPGNATGVVIQHTLPSGAQFVSAASVEPGVDCFHAAGLVTCTLDFMPPDPGFLINVTAILTSVGNAHSTVTVMADQPDPGAFPNDAAADTEVVASAVNITDTLNSPDDRLLDFGQVILGETVAATLTVENTGNDPVSISAVPTPLDAPFLITNPLNCLGAIVQAGTSCLLNIEFSPTEPGDFSDGFPIGVGLQVIPITVTGTGIIGSADLVLEKVADKIELVAGDPLNDRVNFTITVRNDGPDTAQVEVTDELTGQLQIPLGETTNASHGSYNADTGIWSVGPLEPDETATLMIPARVKENQIGRSPKCIHNTATARIVSLGIEDTMLDNNTATVDLSLGGCADLEVAFVEQYFIPTPPSVLWRVAIVSNGPSYHLPWPWHLEINLPTEGLTEGPIVTSLGWDTETSVQVFREMVSGCTDRIIFENEVRRRQLTCDLSADDVAAMPYCEELLFDPTTPNCYVQLTGVIDGPFAGGFTVRAFTSAADDPKMNNQRCPRGGGTLVCDIIPPLE